LTLLIFALLALIVYFVIRKKSTTTFSEINSEAVYKHDNVEISRDQNLRQDEEKLVKLFTVLTLIIAFISLPLIVSSSMIDENSQENPLGLPRIVDFIFRFLIPTVCIYFHEDFRALFKKIMCF
jgi:hypothetical protein